MTDDLVQLLRGMDIVSREPVVLASGERADFYIDVKKAYGYPDVLNMISEKLWERMDKGTSCIATAGYGGISPASVISSRHNLKLTLVRDFPKKHGKGGWIDGYVPNRIDKIAVIDDVFTTGGSLRKIMMALESTRAEILGCYVVVKRGEGELAVPLSYLIKPENLF